MRFRLPKRNRSALAAAGVAGLVFLTGCDAPSRMIVPEPSPPPPSCNGFSLQVAFLSRGGTDEIARGELSLEAEVLGASLHFLSPYTIQVPEGGANLDIPGLRPTLGVFMSNLAFTPLGDGFRQTMTLEWLDELEVVSNHPGCEQLSVSCDRSTLR